MDKNTSTKIALADKASSNAIPVSTKNNDISCNMECKSSVDIRDEFSSTGLNQNPVEHEQDSLTAEGRTMEMFGANDSLNVSKDGSNKHLQCETLVEKGANESFVMVENDICHSSSNHGEPNISATFGGDGEGNSVEVKSSITAGALVKLEGINDINICNDESATTSLKVQPLGKTNKSVLGGGYEHSEQAESQEKKQLEEKKNIRPPPGFENVKMIGNPPPGFEHHLDFQKAIEQQHLETAVSGCEEGTLLECENMVNNMENQERKAELVKGSEEWGDSTKVTASGLDHYRSNLSKSGQDKALNKDTLTRQDPAEFERQANTDSSCLFRQSESENGKLQTDINGEETTENCNVSDRDNNNINTEPGLESEIPNEKVTHNSAGTEKAEALNKLRNASTNDDDLFEKHEETGNDDFFEKYEESKQKAEKKYVYFWRSKSCYSQWYKCSFEVDTRTFSSAEQFMMFKKAELFEDYRSIKKIMGCNGPRKIKEYGREVENFNDGLWRAHCMYFVKEGNLAKFRQNKELKTELFNTSPKILVEASPYDVIWGIGVEEGDPDSFDENTWRGLNLLGYILTEVRDDLMCEEGLISKEEKQVFFETMLEKYKMCGSYPDTVIEDGTSIKENPQEAGKTLDSVAHNDYIVSKSFQTSNDHKHDTKDSARKIGAAHSQKSENCADTEDEHQEGSRAELQVSKQEDLRTKADGAPNQEGKGKGLGDAPNQKGKGKGIGDAPKQGGNGKGLGDAPGQEGKGKGLGDASDQEGKGKGLGDAPNQGDNRTKLGDAHDKECNFTKQSDLRNQEPQITETCLAYNEAENTTNKLDNATTCKYFTEREGLGNEKHLEKLQKVDDSKNKQANRYVHSLHEDDETGKEVTHF